MSERRTLRTHARLAALTAAVAALALGLTGIGTAPVAALEGPADDTVVTEPPAVETPESDVEESQGAQESQEPQEPQEPQRSQEPESAAPLDDIAPFANETLEIALQSKTGVDDAVNDPLDGSTTNDLIRTNDIWTVTAKATQHGTEAQTDVVVQVNAPQGAQFVSLPQYCDASGSSLDPQTLPEPAAPITASSWESLPAQTLTCKLTPEFVGPETTFDFPFEIRVRPEVPAGTSLTAVAAIRSDQVAAVTAEATASVVAAPRYDVSKNAYRATPNSSTVSAGARECSWDRTIACRLFAFPINVSLPFAGAGASPATQISLVDDVSPESLYGVSVDDLEKNGARLRDCYAPTIAYDDTPWARIGTGDREGEPHNSVRDSGTMSCTQAGGPGTDIAVTFDNPDTTAWTYPSEGVRGIAIPADRAAVASGILRFEVPNSVIRDYGTQTGASAWKLNVTNTFTDFNVRDIAGNQNDAAWDDQANNTRTVELSITAGVGQEKYFAGVPGAAGNMSAADYRPYFFQGPPGTTGRDNGDGQLFPGGDTISMNFYSPAPIVDQESERLMAGCDYWDGTKLHLKARNWPGSQATPEGGFAQTIPSNGAPVWVSGADAGDGWLAPGASAIPELTAQYSNGSTGTAGGNCGQGEWFADPADVPGNDPEKAAEGVYTAVNQVRWMAVMPLDHAVTTRYGVSIGLTAADDLEPGDIVPNFVDWYSTTNVTGNETLEQISQRPWATSTYDPATNSGDQGDRHIVSSLNSSINKEILGNDGNWTSGNTETTAGQGRRFRIQPYILAGETTGSTSNLWIEDCMPDSQILLDSNYSYTTAPVEGALECAAEENYVRWDLGPRSTDEMIDPVEYTVRISSLSAPGEYVNRARISAVGDNSDESLRTDSQTIRIINPAGVKIEKTPATPQVQVNNTGAANTEDISWTIGGANIGPEANVFNLDLVDILPASGVDTEPDDGQPASDFSGTLDLRSVEIPAGVTVYYSTTPASELSIDPDHASNSVGGTNPDGAPHVVNPDNWAEWGDSGPADLSAVTALRWKVDGAFNGASNFSSTVVMTPRGNAPGDRYINVLRGEAVLKTDDGAVGSIRELGPIFATTNVVGSSIGDYFWFDANGNGIHDEDETGVPGADVSLSGTDDLGNAVIATTSTDADGWYEFADLRASDADGYTVSFDMPEALEENGYEFTITEAGDDPALDSNADGDGVTVPVIITPGMSDATIDAGISRSAIELVKTADPQNGVDADETITYTFTATNTGETTLEEIALQEESFTNPQGDDITLNGPLVIDEDQSTGTPEALEPGQRVVWTAQYTVTAADLSDDGGLIANTASVSGESPRGNTVTDEDSENVAPVGVGAFTYAKTSDPESGSSVLVGDTVTYTLTVRHNGAGDVRNATITDDLSDVLDDAEYNEDVEPSAGSVTYVDGVLTWSGNLSAAEAVTITYSVTITGDGDLSVRNAATSGDERGQCDDSVGCESALDILPGAYTFSKTSDPASGSEVSVGDRITYTLSMQHNGGGAVAGAGIVDDLAAVLDDAEYNADAAATAGEVSVEGGVLRWTGNLASGEQVDITYSVTVTGGGDDVIRNAVAATDGRGACATDTGCQTVLTLGAGMFVYSKASDPASGTEIQAGASVTYTLTIEHRGEGRVRDATVSDDLADVLDDASYNDDATASSGTVDVADGVLHWTGDLAPEDRVTVTYSVTAHGRGNSTLANSVTSIDTRAACDPDRECATVHPVAAGGAEDPGEGPWLSITGGPLPWIGVSLAAALLIGGGVILAVRRMRQRME
ncbi:SdrD B-like domain-containing protein [Leucobacter sp. L43]|uniref:DUF7927 domain-containing protein n=1 Tax=Leucobacter sp. L43 TaxID=2798040 RepID=UPI0019065A7F|nr:SdrD B-like domain-containing protein [Leucobacter sp. L43]